MILVELCQVLSQKQRFSEDDTHELELVVDLLAGIGLSGQQLSQISQALSDVYIFQMPSFFNFILTKSLNLVLPQELEMLGQRQLHVLPLVAVFEKREHFGTERSRYKLI